MNNKTLPFTKKDIEAIVQKYPTPIHIYDEKGIKDNAQKLIQSFSWVENGGFKNYFAVKACPNPAILKILKEEGMGVDCSSLPELLLAQQMGFNGEDIMFTSNNTPIEDYRKAKELGAIINFDDLTHIAFMEKNVGLPEIACFRYNPGSLRTHKGNAIIGNPTDAKYGVTRKQLFEGYKLLRDKGIKRFGLHTMIASNELNRQAFVETAEMLFDLVYELSIKLDITFEFVNLGGGIGIPYLPDQKPVDYQVLAREIKKIYQKKIIDRGLPQLRVVMECGRVITGPYGYLITKVMHTKDIYKQYIGVDASMANLMRPGMYGAYHHITILGKEKKTKNKTYDIVGSLCENNDKFAIERRLPTIQLGDILAIHDTGAHGHAMGFNYNGKLRSAELLLHSNKSVQLIRRAETVDDYFATLNFSEENEV